MQARAAIENEAEILKCEHHGMAHLKRCPLPQGDSGAIIEAAAWKDTLQSESKDWIRRADRPLPASAKDEDP